MDSIISKTDKTLSEIEKVKKEVRLVNKDKMNFKRTSTCNENDDFRRRAAGPINFLIDNEGKLKSMLKGERDACPTDLGNGSSISNSDLFLNFLVSSDSLK